MLNCKALPTSRLLSGVNMSRPKPVMATCSSWATIMFFFTSVQFFPCSANSSLAFTRLSLAPVQSPSMRIASKMPGTAWHLLKTFSAIWMHCRCVTGCKLRVKIPAVIRRHACMVMRLGFVLPVELTTARSQTALRNVVRSAEYCWPYCGAHFHTFSWLFQPWSPELTFLKSRPVDGSLLIVRSNCTCSVTAGAIASWCEILRMVLRGSQRGSRTSVKLVSV
mmetsp:Transcript_34173/g.82033  ORF Transcript_34173/g.82033 Transcript_34173/m.82033 type:complete len:222 (-) Transcript_34173:464-1129(-)